MNKHEKEFISSKIRAGNNAEALRVKKSREKERNEARRSDLEGEKTVLLRDKRQFEIELASGILSPAQRMEAQQLLGRTNTKLYQVNILLNHNTHTDSMFEEQERLL